MDRTHHMKVTQSTIPSRILLTFSYAKDKYRLSRAFGIGIFNRLLDLGVDIEAVKPMIPQLKEVYREQIKGRARKLVKGDPERHTEAWAKDVVENYGEGWYGYDNRIKGWEEDYDLFSEISPEDKKLYDKVANAICDYDWMIAAESDIAGSGMWSRIVWDTIQTVRQGGGILEVENCLNKHGTMPPDKYMREMELNIKEILENLVNEENFDDDLDFFKKEIAEKKKEIDSFYKNRKENARRVVNIIQSDKTR